MADSATTHQHTVRAAVLRALPRIVILVLLVAVVLQILAASTYRVSAGRVTFRIAPAWPGGHVVMPLGPAGVLQLDTHRTPFDIRMDMTLDESQTTLSGATRLADGLPALEPDAVAAFDRHLRSKIPWLLAFGVLAGLLVSGGGRRWFVVAVLHALAGVLVTVLAVAAMAGATVLTVDHTPRAHYEGLASNMPRILDLVRKTTATSPDRAASLSDFVRGLEIVNAQLDHSVRQRGGEDVTRILVMTDVHDNEAGMILGSQLVGATTSPISAVLLGGDMTVSGTAIEAEIFANRFAPGRVPVFVVGGTHEDAAAMKAFAAAGYVVLDGREVNAAGVTVYGVGDPLDSSPLSATQDPLLAAADAQLLAAWQRFEVAPHILLVHDQRAAQSLIAYAQKNDQQVTVVCGHTHVPSITQVGSVTVINGGTAGASGYGAIAAGNELPYTFQVLEFSTGAEPRLLDVMTYTYQGLDGRSAAEFTPIAP